MSTVLIKKMMTLCTTKLYFRLSHKIQIKQPGTHSSLDQCKANIYYPGILAFLATQLELPYLCCCIISKLMQECMSNIYALWHNHIINGGDENIHQPFKLNKNSCWISSSPRLRHCINKVCVNLFWGGEWAAITTISITLKHIQQGRLTQHLHTFAPQSVQRISTRDMESPTLFWLKTH